MVEARSSVEVGHAFDLLEARTDEFARRAVFARCPIFTMTRISV
jgi:hypothetical protein